MATAKGSFQNDIEIEKVEPGFIRENLGKGVEITDHLDLIFKYNLTSFNMDHISNINSTYNQLCDEFKKHFKSDFENCVSKNFLKKPIEEVIEKYNFLKSHNKHNVDENASRKKRDISAVDLGLFGASIEQHIKISQSSESQQKLMQEKNQHIKIIDQYLLYSINIEKIYEDQFNLLDEMYKNFGKFDKFAQYSLSLLNYETDLAIYINQLLESVEDTLESIEKLNEIITTQQRGDFSQNIVTISELKNLLASIKLREGTSLPFEINELTFDLMENLFKFKVTYVNNVIYVSMLIPLKDKNSHDFDLQRIFSVPMIENDTLTYIIPSSDYILISGNGAFFSPVDIENCNKYDEIYYCENIRSTFRKEHACFLNKAKVFSHCKIEKAPFDGFKVENLPMKNALLVITNTEKTLTAEKIDTREKGSIKLTKGSHMLRSKKLIELNFNDAYFKFGEMIFLNITFDKPYK
ncbi:hypothetical protein PVAND_006280 [Polypedilum vanderplanki]|uniref:Uncharacterized protein n=1 Tax=Polypedilum vanderplanki TaxID=319348 RepID=A0A9J6C3Q1_POLVA|nr:hypothetical protein PVAND_006280 [Polypedilum vanderplanki]